MYPEFHIKLFSLEFDLPLFGTMMAIGVLFFAIITLRLFHKHKIDETTIDKLIIIIAIAGAMFAIGAHCFDSLWHSIEEAKESGTFVWRWSGITYSGGLLTAIATYLVAYYFILRSERHLLFERLDIVVVGLCVAHAFGRIGCFLGGCCYGKVVEPHTFLSVYYPIVYPTTYKWVLPTQLYESCFLFIFAAVLFFFVKKNRSAWYLIGYNVFRFFLEYLRGDDRGFSPFGFLSPSQFLSIIMLLMGIALLIWRKKIENWLTKKDFNPLLATDANIDVATDESNKEDGSINE